jgi:hypothetical protein
MSYWVRRDQWPNMELGPFVDRSTAEGLLPGLADAFGSFGAEWTWAVVEHGAVGTPTKERPETYMPAAQFDELARTLDEPDIPTEKP